MGARKAFAAALVMTATALWAMPAAASAAPHCDGDGTSGKRVQAVYAHVNGQAPVGNADALISAWAEQVDRTFNVSAHKTAPAGFAFPRWAFTAGCGRLDILHIDIGDPGTSFQGLRVALGAANNSGGIGATPGTLVANLNRKYMVFMDKDDCGGETSDFLPDSTADPDLNISNQNPGAGFQRAMIARYCLGDWQTPPSPQLFNFGIPHELVHLLGGVPPTAPHAVGGGHTSQFEEVMSAGNPPPVPECSTPFEGLDQLLLLDCGNDDYFSMAPPIGSYLASNWNVARSCFLTTSGVQNVPPDSRDCPTPRKCKKHKKKHRRSAESAKKKKQGKCKKKRKKRR